MPSDRFADVFGSTPRFVARAPGRVNLIGEHTDYNGGYVFPMAVDRDIRMAFRPNDSRNVDLVSLDFDDKHAFSLDNVTRDSGPAWANYFMGVCHILQKEGHTLRGMQAVIKGDVPLGAGLSSSAALEVASAMALCAAADLRINREKLARVCQRAENEFAGVNCGIMDQFASLLCRKNSALLINCATLEHECVPFSDAMASVVVVNTMVKHSLAESPYNERRRECAKAFKLLQRRRPEMETYRDMPVAFFKMHEHDLEDPIKRRARHVVTENARVLAAVEELRAGDLIAFGALMDASHESLKNDFEVSCGELDLLVSLARDQQGTYGARMTGGGFGGCIVALVRPDAVDSFKANVARGYRDETGLDPDIYVFRPSEGASVEKVGGP